MKTLESPPVEDGSITPHEVTSIPKETQDSTPEDGSNPPGEAVTAGGGSDQLNSTAVSDGLGLDPAQLKSYHGFLRCCLQEIYQGYLMELAPRLRPIAAVDSVKEFIYLYGAWPQYLSARGLILPEIIVSLVSCNAIGCTRAVLPRTAPQLRGYDVDLNVRHDLFGFAPLHSAAEKFNVDMVMLLLRHGASTNLRTKGRWVIEGLLPLNVAVENAAMHKYLEDHWAYGEPIENLIYLLCLPEIKMCLDTTRVIAKHTDNIVDEIWNYIDTEKLVPASILLLAAQKQLRSRVKFSSGNNPSLTGFNDIKSRIDVPYSALHREWLATVKDGKKSWAKRLNHKKEILLTARVILEIVNKAGETLEKYIQTHSEVPHEEIVEHVKSILTASGIVPFGKGIDTGKLNCCQYPWQTLIDNSESQRGATCEAEANKSSSLKSQCSKNVKASPKELSMDHGRHKFFPLWKSVLSARLQEQLGPTCQPRIKDITKMKQAKSSSSSSEQSKDIQSPEQPCHTTTPLGFAKDLGVLIPMPSISDYQSKRRFCTLASMSLNALRHA